MVKVPVLESKPKLDRLFFTHDDPTAHQITFIQRHSGQSSTASL
jgi:hypothetical protein